METKYRITTKYRSGEDDEQRMWNEVDDCGGFRSTVDFTITNSTGGVSKVNGIIVQVIKKTTIVDIYDENGGGNVRTLNTSQSISDYTNGHVKHMNDVYLEYFEVSNGESVDGDQFGNGPICVYDETGPVIDDEVDIGCGKLLQNGYAVFIPSPVSNQIKKKYPWNNNPSLPANGLYSLPFDKQTWDQIFQKRQSNIYDHTVSYEWKYLNIIEQNHTKLYIDTCKESPQIVASGHIGGKTRNNKTKRSNKIKN